MNFSSKKINISDYSFNACDNLTDDQKQLLANKFAELSIALQSVTTYPSGRIAEEKRQVVQDEVIASLNQYPDLMYMAQPEPERNYSHTLARECLRAECFDAVKYMLQDEKAPLLRDNLGQNIGMYCAMEGNEELVLMALDNYEASTQQSFNQGVNIGMIAASKSLVNATMKALDNPDASIQQNVDGDNIGMICARISTGNHKMIPCFEHAATNKQAILQQNNNGRTMFHLAEFAGYSSSKLREKFGEIYKQAIAEHNAFQIPENLN